MKTPFDVIATNRKLMAPFLDKFTLTQLNTIPEGFTNSIFWNIAHVVVTQQLLVYKLSGLPMSLPEEWIERYKKGTKPEQDATQEEVEYIKEKLLSTVDQMRTDYENKLFQNYTEYPTSTGFVLQNVDDAIGFNVFHEGIHLGVLLGLKKFI